MRIDSVKVGMLPCSCYSREKIGECLAGICSSLSWTPPSGQTVLLKPNLVMARGHNGLACTHPEFVASVVRFFLDYGLKVKIGDSPAFGNACQVMSSCGITKALKGLDVEKVNFSPGPRIKLSNGQKITVAREIFETDLIINLPKLKAHGQMGMTLAVKNLFGLVVAWRKWLLHQSLGREVDKFLNMLVDLLDVIPDTFTLLDGVIAMQETGPIRGRPFKSGLIAGSWNPVALDTSIMEVLSLNPGVNLLSRIYTERRCPGSSSRELDYTLRSVTELKVSNFIAPAGLKPVPFSFRDSLVSLAQRSATFIRK